MTIVGIVGATGGVGEVAARLLAEEPAIDLLLGSRRCSAAKELAASIDPFSVCGRGVDVDDPVQLREFVGYCDIVVNAAAPSFRIRDKVAAICVELGRDYVDPAGDPDLEARIAHRWRSGRSCVLSAGLTPGVSGLLPKAIAAREGIDPASFTLYGGGCDSFTHGAALDYLEVLDDPEHGTTGAWFDGGQIRRGAAILEGEYVRGFSGPVSLVPYLSTEIARVAGDLGVDEAYWYSAFEGGKVIDSISRPSAHARAHRGDWAEQLAAAARLDSFGRNTHQTIHLTMTSRSGGSPLAVTARAASASIVTGTAVAAAVVELDAGRYPRSMVHFDQHGEPGRLLDQLARFGLELLDEHHDATTEEGIL